MSEPEVEKCATCGMPPCDGCNRAGLVILGTTPDNKMDRATPCPHTKLMRVKEFLGPAMSRVKHVADTPLEKLMDRNLLIRLNSWEGILPHLKWCLTRRGLRFRYKVITDERVLQVYVGSESFRLKSVEARETEGYCNSLADLMEDSQLLIVRIGHIFHKNKAAEGSFMEGLSGRRAKNLPTWIVDENPRRRLEQCAVWGPGLQDYMTTYNFQEVTLDDHDEVEPLLPLDDEDELQAVRGVLASPRTSAPPVRVAQAPTPPAYARATFSPDFSIDETGLCDSARKPFKKKKW